jgi:hypothetical protein
MGMGSRNEMLPTGVQTLAPWGRARYAVWLESRTASVFRFPAARAEIGLPPSDLTS